MSTVMGVDAAAGQWLAVVLRDGAFAGAELCPGFAELVARHPQAEVIAVDIPIGLPLRTSRPADALARRFVGPKHVSSVFQTFPAEVLHAKSHEEAVEAAKRLLGKALSLQSYGLSKRIFEVAVVAATDPRVVEVHPEVSFRELNAQMGADAPLEYSKHSWSGIWERLTLLKRAGIELPGHPPGGGVAAPDDVVDAAVASWSAERVATGVSRTLPSPPPTDLADGGPIYY